MFAWPIASRDGAAHSPAALLSVGLLLALSGLCRADEVTAYFSPAVCADGSCGFPCYVGVYERLTPAPAYVLSGGGEPLQGEFTVTLGLTPPIGGLEGVFQLAKHDFIHWEMVFDDVRVLTPGRYTLMATPSGQAQGLEPLSTPIAVGLVGRQVIPQRTSPVVVDGVLGRDEWGGGSPLLFGFPQQDVLPGRWTGPSDYRGRVRLRQDADNLYFAVAATDDVVSFPATSDADLYNRDGIEFFLGLDKAADCRRTTYGPGDFQVIVSADSDAQGNLTARWFSPQAAGTVYGNPSSVFAKRTNDGYVIEGQLPWSLLKPGFTPTKDTVIGLNLMAKDLDSTTPGEDSAFNLTGLESASKDPSGWTTAGPGETTPSYTLYWAQFPGLSGVSRHLNPYPIVEVRHAGADIATTYEGPVTLSLQTNVGDGWLRGTTTVFATQGRAEFPDVTIDRRGYYSLVATANGAGSEPSPAFDVWEAYGVSDIAAVLHYVAGLAEGAIDWERLDVSRNNVIDLPDAVLMARKTAGLDANP